MPVYFIKNTEDSFKNKNASRTNYLEVVDWLQLNQRGG